MKKYIAHLVSTAPYSQSRHYEVEKLEREQSKDYEARTWRERMHVTKEGNVFIPPMAFKNCLSEAAKYLGMQIKGKGKATYTKHIEAGVIMVERIILPNKKEDVRGEWLFLPSDGVRGSGKRVMKCMPVIDDWSAIVPIVVLDEIVTKDVLLVHLKAAGDFIGIGRWRVRNNGIYGRFLVESLKETD